MTEEEFITYAKKYGLFNAIINLHLPYTFFSYNFLKEIASKKTPNVLEKWALEENAECYLDLYGNYYPINDIEDVLKINEFLGFLTKKKTMEIIKTTNIKNKYHLTLQLDNFLVETIYEPDYNEIRSILYAPEKIFKVLIHTINDKTTTTLKLKYPQINLSTQEHIDIFSNDIHLMKTLTDNIQTKYIPFIVNACKETYFKNNKGDNTT